MWSLVTYFCFETQWKLWFQRCRWPVLQRGLERPVGVVAAEGRQEDHRPVWRQLDDVIVGAGASAQLGAQPIFLFELFLFKVICYSLGITAEIEDRRLKIRKIESDTSALGHCKRQSICLPMTQERLAKSVQDFLVWDFFLLPKKWMPSCLGDTGSDWVKK